MVCTEARENLELLALDGLDPALRAEVEAHLAQCARCRAAANDYHEIVRAIRPAEKTSTRATDGFVQAVRFAVDAEIAFQRQQRRVRRVIGVAGALAAAALIAVGLWGVMSGLPPDDRAGRPIAASGPDSPLLPRDTSGVYGGSHSLAAGEAEGIAVVGQTVYLRRDEAKGANVAAVDAVTGRTMWQGRFAVRGYLAADGQHVFCLADGPGGTLDLVALDADDGAELWRFARDRPRRLSMPCGPVALGDRRVCWANGRTIHMLDATSGRTIWRRTMPGRGPMSGLVADRAGLYVATNQALYCIDHDRGADVWVRQLPDELAGRGGPLIALADGQAYVVQQRPARPSRLLAIRIETRQLLWHRTIEPARSILAAAGGVYLRRQKVVAFGSRDGTLLWSRPATGCGPLTLIDGRIYFVDMSQRGRLIALDPATGTSPWQVAGIRSCDAPTKVGQAGCIKTQSGTLRAVALAGRGDS